MQLQLLLSYVRTQSKNNVKLINNVYLVLTNGYLNTWPLCTMLAQMLGQTRKDLLPLSVALT
jgi:hypothetical protein